MNNRDCPHGSKLGKCDTCDLIVAEQRIAELMCEKRLRDEDALDSLAREGGLHKRIAALEKVEERYNRLKNMAVKKTAYDIYGDGCHWTIGFFGDDAYASFDDAVDQQAI